MSAISELKKRTKSGNIVAETIAQSGGGSGHGAGVFWVNITSPDGGTTWTADKTVDEVLAAVQGGQLVYADFDGQYVPLVNSYAEEDHKDLTFAVIVPNSYDSAEKKLFIESTRIGYSAEGTVTNLAVETGTYSFSVSKTG